MNRLFSLTLVLSLPLILSGCSSQDSSKPAPKAGLNAPMAGVMMADNQKNLLAKYVEVADSALPIQAGESQRPVQRHQSFGRRHYEPQAGCAAKADNREAGRYRREPAPSPARR